MLVLTVMQGPDKGRRFELPDNEPQLIGRSSEALPLTDATISRRHAELTPDDGRWYINDLHSANGTYVNSLRITRRTLLHDGDQLRTGESVLVFGQVDTSPFRGKVQVVPGESMETSFEASAPSNQDSLIMAVPMPEAAAAQHLKILYDVMQVVGTEFDKTVLLERVMELVFDHFQPDRGCILLRDKLGLKVEPVVVRYRRRSPAEQDQPISVSRTIVQHVLTRSEGVLSSNAMTDKRFSSGDSIQAFGIHSAICVPIKFHDRVHGVLYIDSKIVNYTFTEDQLRLLTAIGAQAGLALENADLYQQGMASARLAAVGETVASLSHSIRNMMQAIRGGGEVVELGLRKKDLQVVSNGWDILARSLDRIFELTMNMLAFSKKRKPEFELSNIDMVLKEVVELFGPQCKRRNVKLEVGCDGHTPPVSADAGGLQQAVLNLLNNALDAVEPGEGWIRLRSGYDSQSQRAWITVSDNGSGIDEQSLARLFEPFYSTKGLKGTGLGLVVTKKIIEEHGGTIEVKSASGQGTTFKLIFSGEPQGDPSETH